MAARSDEEGNPMTLNGWSKVFYALARGSRDVQAIRRGPRAVGKRLVRKAAGRTYGRMIRRWIP
jgi:hypothetical protein